MTDRDTEVSLGVWLLRDWWADLRRDRDLRILMETFGVPEHEIRKALGHD